MVVDHEKEEEFEGDLKMAKYLGPSCRLCRAEGVKLFLKGTRCHTDKCAFERKKYPPGEHKKEMRKRFSDYGFQLREKQKVRRIYGILEKQFRNYFKKAEKHTGITGENLLRLLECRLDNIIFRLGFVTTRKEARQLVNHGHFLVNNRKVNIPSYIVKKGDEIALSKKSKEIPKFKEALKLLAKKEVPAWLKLDTKVLKGQILELPSREQMEPSIQEQLIVELYSK